MVQAAVITSLLTLGLTLCPLKYQFGSAWQLTAFAFNQGSDGSDGRYTFKSKRDFSFLGAALWPLLFRSQNSSVP